MQHIPGFLPACLTLLSGRSVDDSLASAIGRSLVDVGPTLNELLESAIDWRARLNALVEFDYLRSTLGDTLGGEFEFLLRLANDLTQWEGTIIPRTPSCKAQMHRTCSIRTAHACTSPSRVST